MKIYINVEDFYLDDADNLEGELKKYIINEAVAEIFRKIEQKINSQIFEEIEKVIKSALKENVEETTKNFVLSGKTKSRNDSRALVTIEERIKQDFEQELGYNYIRDGITKIAKQFASDLKQRYDLLFASQFVAKMNELGMLREDVAKLLLPENN